MKRIAYLDMLRGYALICIMLDHMPASIMRGVTLSNFALFDAAELFVLLSGFLVGVVWLRVSEKEGERAAQKRFFRRSVQVWWALLVGSLLMAGLSALLLHAGLRHTAIWNEYARMIVEAPLAYMVAVGSLWLQPNLLDVLALYVVLIATVPLALPVLVRWPVIFFSGSLLIWWFAAPLNGMLPNHRDKGGFLFNPFGWQLLFFIGAGIGVFRRWIMNNLRRWSWWLTVFSVIILSYGLVYDLSGRFGMENVKDYMAVIIGPINKWSMDGARVISILAASWVVASCLTGPLSRLADTALGRGMAEIGRGGLLSFIACVLLSVMGDALQLMVSDEVRGWRMVIDVWAVLALWCVATIWLRRDSLICSTRYAILIKHTEFRRQKE